MEEWIKSLPWKDWGAAIIAGLFALSATMVTVVVRVVDGRHQRDVDARAEARKIEHAEDIAQTKDLTARIKALMDGYESRINDLTSEITSLRGDIRGLKQQLDSHQNICRLCPFFEEKTKANAAKSATATADDYP